MSVMIRHFLVPFIAGLLVLGAAVTVMSFEGPAMSFFVAVAVTFAFAVIIGAVMPRHIKFAGWWMSIPVLVAFLPGAFFTNQASRDESMGYMWGLPVLVLVFAYLGMYLGSRLSYRLKISSTGEQAGDTATATD